jgi:adenine-specific DNA-methyltransferase
MRPDVGTQAQFKKKKPPVTYRYDSSLSPALEWDGQNSARELGERQLAVLNSELAEIRRLVAQGFSPANPDAGLKAGATSALRGPGRAGANDLHGPAPRGEVWQ